jgi:hypothetical protein
MQESTNLILKKYIKYSSKYMSYVAKIILLTVIRTHNHPLKGNIGPIPHRSGRGREGERGGGIDGERLLCLVNNNIYKEGNTSYHISPSRNWSGK